MKTLASVFAAFLVFSQDQAKVTWAVPEIFFGEDQGLGEHTRLVNHPIADAARNEFLSRLSGVGEESFESFSTGASPTPTLPLQVTFPGVVEATIEGDGYVETVTVPTGTNGYGRYPVDGVNYYEVTGHFEIHFSLPTAAFGFYGTDIGDFGGNLVVHTHTGLIKAYTIPHNINAPGGGVLYYAIIDVDDPFDWIEFDNTAPGTDYFGFDLFTAGTPPNVNPLPLSDAPIDIKFCSNPNGFNCRGQGVVPMTVFGTDDLTVTEIDMGTVQLCLSDESKCLGSESLRAHVVKDRGSPADVGAGQCTVIEGVEQDYLNQDGHLDLELAWEKSDVVGILLDDCCGLTNQAAGPSFIFKAQMLNGIDVVSSTVNDSGVDQLFIQNGAGNCHRFLRAKGL